jgi:signal peptidase I
MQNKLNKISRFSFIIWALCAVLVVGMFLYTIGFRGELLNETSSTLSLIIIGLLGFCVLAFLSGTFFLTWNLLLGESKSKYLVKGLLAFFIQVIFPFYYLCSIISSYFKLKPKFKDKRHLNFLSGLFVFLPIWLVGYFLMFKSIQELAGLGAEFAPVMASESMAPTIPGGTGYRYYDYKNIWYRLNSPKKYQFKHGDIISFSTPNTRKIIADNNLENYNFIKRVIALPGDKVMITGGIVFLNGKPLDEPYTLEANKTTTGDIIDKDKKILAKGFLYECEEIIVPDKSMFVLGDNRQNSDDSRIIGFVGFDDVTVYFPFEEQKIEYYEGVNRFKHDEKWRTEGNFDESTINQALEHCE